ACAGLSAAGEENDSDARAEAATALARLAAGSETSADQHAQALRALTDACAKESDVIVLCRLAEAAEAWPNAPSVGAALLEQLARDDNAQVMDHLVSIAGRIRLEGAEPVLIALAEDQTAPPNVRVSAVWSLGQFDSPAVRAALRRWSEHPEKFFGDPL